MQICGFAICGLRHQRDLRIAIAEEAQGFANLQFADYQENLRAHLCQAFKNVPTV
jgi:hypothetical protein